MSSTTGSPNPTSPDTFQVAFGIGLMLVGAVLTLDVFGMTSATNVLRIWPAALVLAGVLELGRAHDSGARIWAWGWIVVGGWLLLRTFGLTRVGFWELFWPVAIIAVGVKLGLDALNRRDTAAVQSSPLAAGASHLVAILSSSKRVVRERPFLGASLTACLGSCELDLRHADIAPGSDAVLEVFGLFGSHELTVPDHWNVVSKVTPIAASVDDRRGATSTAVNPPRLIIRGVLLFSGLTIQR